MKQSIKEALGVFGRMVLCGVSVLFIYLLLAVIFTFMFTKEDTAMIYRLQDGEYTLSEIQHFDDKSAYKPPEGDDIAVSYRRSELPLAAKIADGVITEGVAVFMMFTLFASLLGKSGMKARKEGTGLHRGITVGFLAAIPAFASWIAFVIATARHIEAAMPVYLVCNGVFVPLLRMILSISGNRYSVPAAVCTGAVFLIIPLLTQLAFRYGQAYNELDFSKMMYKKKKESSK